MKLLSSLILCAILTTAAFGQTGRAYFQMSERLTFSEKDDGFIRTRSARGGRQLMLLGKSRLQIWEPENTKLVNATGHMLASSLGSNFLQKLDYRPERTALSPNSARGVFTGKIKGYGNDLVASVWDLSAGRLIDVLKAEGEVQTVKYSADGATILTISGPPKDSVLTFWNAADNSHRNSIRVADLSFAHLTPDGTQVYTGSAKAKKWAGSINSYESGKSISLWNTASGKLEKTFTAGADLEFANWRNENTAVSADERYLVSRVTGNKLAVWETAGDGQPLYVLNEADPKSELRLLGITRDSKYLMAVRGEKAELYKLATGKLYRTFPMLNELVYSVSNDSRFLFIKDSYAVYAFDIDKEKQLYRLPFERKQEEPPNPNGPNYVHTLEDFQASPDSKYVMVYGYSEVRIHDIETGALLQSLIDPKQVRYTAKGKISDSGLHNNMAGWAGENGSIYVFDKTGNAFFLWNKN